MDGFQEIFSTNNPIEFDRLLHLLEQSGVEATTKGREALNIGNVELTGIAGASILVPEGSEEKAQQILASVGYENNPSESDHDLRVVYIGLGILLLGVLLYMILSLF